jgi:hypothetical protein
MELGLPGSIFVFLIVGGSLDPLTLGILTSVLSTVIIAALGLGGRMMLRGMKDWMEDEIKHHLVPNGGSSLADKLNRIEGNVNQLVELHKDGHPHGSQKP